MPEICGFILNLWKHEYVCYVKIHSFQISRSAFDCNIVKLFILQIFLAVRYMKL